MGYWGYRAKDGDGPLDLLGEFEDGPLNGPKNRLTAVQFVDKKFKEVKDANWHDAEYEVVGLVTLLVEKGYKFRKAIYKRCLKKVESEEDQSREDIKFFTALLNGEPAPIKKKRIITIEVETNEMDEEEAMIDACKKAGKAYYHNIYRSEGDVVLKVDGKKSDALYRERWGS